MPVDVLRSRAAQGDEGLCALCDFIVRAVSAEHPQCLRGGLTVGPDNRIKFHRTLRLELLQLLIRCRVKSNIARDLQVA
jgi:hypothetical protein